MRDEFKSEVQRRRQVRRVEYLLVLLLLVGCGRSDGRQSLVGTVTLDNVPLADGSIAFHPLTNTTSPTAGSRIEEGHFRVRPEKGTFSGTFRVTIIATRPTGKKVTNIVDSAVVDEYVQFIPARYNRQSELSIEVKEDGSNQFEFALSSE